MKIGLISCENFRASWVVVSLLVMLVLLSACGVRDDMVYRDAVAWIEGYALPGERVAVPESVARYFSHLDAILLAEDADAFKLLETVQTERPDIVVAWRGVAWDGVRAQPWFREHYHPLDAQIADTIGGSLWVFGYTPSHFDDGALLPVEQALGVPGVDIKAVRISQPRLTPGEPLYVSLTWTGDLFALPDAHRLVLQLLAADQSHILAQIEQVMVDGLPVDLVRDGENVISRHVLAIPDDLPAGDYHLVLSIYRRNGEPVMAEPLALAALFSPPAVTLATPTPDFESAWRFGDAIEFVGYDVAPWLTPGEPLRVTLYWFASDTVPGDYKVFIHLMDADGNLVAQDDARPLNWTYPTAQWQPGEYIRDEHVLALGDVLPRGDYTLFAGMYAAETSVRLGVTDAQGQPLPESAIELRVVKVR